MKRTFYLILAITGLLVAACGVTNETQQLSNEDLGAADVAQIQTEEAQAQIQLSQPESAYNSGVPALNPIDLMLRLEGYGFTCATPEDLNEQVIWYCDLVTDEYQFSVTSII